MSKLPHTPLKKNEQYSHLCNYQHLKRQKDKIPFSSKDHLSQGRYTALQSILLGSQISCIALNRPGLSRSYSTSALHDYRRIEESLFGQALQRLPKHSEISYQLSNEKSRKYSCEGKPEKYLSSKPSLISSRIKNSQCPIGRHLSFIEPSNSELILIRRNGLHQTYIVYQFDKHSLNPIGIFPVHEDTPRRCACYPPKENQAFITTDSLYPYCSYNHFLDRSSGMHDTNQQSSTCRSFQQIPTDDNDDDNDEKSLISKISMKRDHRRQSKKRHDQLYGDCDETVNPPNKVITHHNKIIQTDSCLQQARHKQKGVQTDLTYCVRSVYGGAIKVYNHPPNSSTKLEYYRQTSKKTLALVKKGNLRKRRPTTITTTAATRERHGKFHKPTKYFSVSPMRKYYHLMNGKTKHYRMNKFSDR
ncbi:unnamed protein product [Trichobilharzia szidati]|nr:unnamed protein product [Trichobilharzia szidati]